MFESTLTDWIIETAELAGSSVTLRVDLQFLYCPGFAQVTPAFVHPTLSLASLASSPVPLFSASIFVPLRCVHCLYPLPSSIVLLSASPVPLSSVSVSPTLPCVSCLALVTSAGAVH